jgi:hypothetical protein
VPITIELPELKTQTSFNLAQPWAKQGLESAAKRMALKGYSLNWPEPLSEADSSK